MSAALRLQPIPNATFDAWRVVQGKAHVLIKGAESDEDWRLATTVCAHKEQVFILEHMNCGRDVLHIYAVREKAATYRYNAETKLAERFKPRFLDLLTSVEVTEFSPVEPWRWAPGADVVGHRPSFIEGASA